MPKIIISHGRQSATHNVPDGTTLQSFMESQHPETKNFPVPVIALYGGEPVLREKWPTLALMGDAVAVFFGLPMGGGGGGGSNPLQMVLTAAIAVASIAASIMTAGALTPVMGAMWAGVVGGLAGAAISIGGGLLMNALFPTPSVSAGQQSALSAEAASPTYGLNSTGNQARLFQPELEVFGRLRITPDKVANAWSMYEGNEMFLYQVFGLGRGSYAVHEFGFGDAAFWREGTLLPGAYYDENDPDSIKVEIVKPGGSVTLFPDNIETSIAVSGQELIAPNAENHAVLGPFPVCPPGSTTNRILCDFTMPRGCGRFSDKGDLENFEVYWRIEYQRIDDFGNTIGGWSTLDNGGINMSTQTPQRRTIAVDVAEGRYQARCVRTSKTTGDSRTLDEIRWEALRAMLPGTLSYPQTCVALRLKATNKLSQSAAQNFFSLQTRRLPVYNPDTKTWSAEQPTRGFAAAVCAVAKASWGGRMSDSGIDLDGLWRLDKIVEAKGWHFDAAIDGPYSVWQLIVEICAAVRVIPRPSGSKLTFVMDGPDRPVRHLFTPHDIIRNSFKPRWNTFDEGTPDDVNVTYLDEDAGYAKRDVRAVLPASESREPAQRHPIGIVNRKHAHAYGMHLAACNRYRRVGAEFQTEAIGRLLNVGDVVAINHPRLRSSACGQLTDWNEQTLVLRLDKEVKSANKDEERYLTLTDPQGRVWGPVKLDTLTNEGEPGQTALAKIDAKDYAALIMQGFDSPFEWVSRGYDRQPTVWTLQTGREISGRYLIEKITPVDMYRHTIQVVRDDPRVYSVNVACPIWENRANLPESAALAAPTGLTMLPPEESKGPVTLKWFPSPGAYTYEVEYSRNGKKWRRLGRVNTNLASLYIDAGAARLRVAALNDQRQSAWAYWRGNII